MKKKMLKICTIFAVVVVIFAPVNTLITSTATQLRFPILL